MQIVEVVLTHENERSGALLFLDIDAACQYLSGKGFTENHWGEWEFRGSGGTTVAHTNRRPVLTALQPVTATDRLPPDTLQQAEHSEKTETFDAEEFNRVFAEGGLPECSNCETQQEVLTTVEFIMHRVGSLYRRLEAVKQAAQPITSPDAETAPRR